MGVKRECWREWVEDAVDSQIAREENARHADQDEGRLRCPRLSEHACSSFLVVVNESLCIICC